MPKALKFILIVVGIVLYLNIGYLFAYSFDPKASETAVSHFIVKTFDFMNVSGKIPDADNVSYVMVAFFWPAMAVTLWIANLGKLLWLIIVWLFAGGFWRWIGFTL